MVNAACQTWEFWKQIKGKMPNTLIISFLTIQIPMGNNNVNTFEIS